MTFKIQLTLGLLVLAAGCAPHRDKIVFSDEAEIRSEAATATPPPAEKGLDQADERKIEQLIFGYLLERHFWDDADYSAVFLQADDAQVAAMMKLFPHHRPPIKQSYHARIEAHRSPVDQDTGRPAMILSADVNEPNADGSVDAIGRWYAGDAVTGFRAFHFEKADGQWQMTTGK